MHLLDQSVAKEKLFGLSRSNRRLVHDGRLNASNSRVFVIIVSRRISSSSSSSSLDLSSSSSHGIPIIVILFVNGFSIQCSGNFVSHQLVCRSHRVVLILCGFHLLGNMKSRISVVGSSQSSRFHLDGLGNARRRGVHGGSRGGR